MLNIGEKIRVQALVTDGQQTGKVLTVARTAAGFIFIYSHPPDGYHTTYHQSGYVHTVRSTGVSLFNQEMRCPPLNNFVRDDSYIVFGSFLNIDKPSTWGLAPPSKIKRYTKGKHVLIDLRSCIGKTNVVSIHAPLLVPGDLEPLDYYHKNCSVLRCEVFKETVPWFAVVGYYKLN